MRIAARNNLQRNVGLMQFLLKGLNPRADLGRCIVIKTRHNVRGANHRHNSIACCHARHGQGCFHVRRTIIQPRQNMRMQVDQEVLQFAIGIYLRLGRSRLFVAINPQAKAKTHMSAVERKG